MVSPPLTTRVPDPSVTWLRDRRVERVRAVLARRGIESDFVESAEEALALVLAHVPAGGLVGLGGSTTVRQIGLWDALRGLDVIVVNHQLAGLSKIERHQVRQRGLAADLYVMGCNAIAEHGAIVVANESGNAIAALAFAARRVVIVASAAKIVPTVDEAIGRVFRVAAPANAHRSSGFRPPCSVDGICREEACDVPDRLCNKLLVLYGEAIPGRVRLILVGEPLGL